LNLSGAPALNLLTRHRMPTVFGVTVGYQGEHAEIGEASHTRRLRLSLTLDRERAAPVLSLSEFGANEIAHVAIDPLHGLHNYQVLALANELELPRISWHPLADAAQHVYRILVLCDALTITLAPLAFEPNGRLIMLDAAIHIDTSANFRHPDFAISTTAEADDERLARIAGISYLRLDGQIGCIANGAGLAMATMDLIAATGLEYGLRPANFMDIGGGARADAVETGIRLMLQYLDVRAVVMNVFGGLTRGDEVAQGLIAACGETGPAVPFILRMHGTQAQIGRARIESAGLTNIYFASTLTEAVSAVIDAARHA
jgi:succinyl-CoA synthetase beta subunit